MHAETQERLVDNVCYMGTCEIYTAPCPPFNFNIKTACTVTPQTAYIGMMGRNYLYTF